MKKLSKEVSLITGVLLVKFTFIFAMIGLFIILNQGYTSLSIDVKTGIEESKLHEFIIQESPFKEADIKLAIEKGSIEIELPSISMDEARSLQDTIIDFIDTPIEGKGIVTSEPSRFSDLPLLGKIMTLTCMTLFVIGLIFLAITLYKFRQEKRLNLNNKE